MNHLNSYITKAVDAYPHQLEEALESLQYALAQDPQNPYALILMGQMLADQFYNYKEAIRYFEDALSNDLDNPVAINQLIKLYMECEEFEKAEKLFHFALSRKGSDKEDLFARAVILYEKQKRWKKALKMLEKLKLHLCHNHYKIWIEDCQTRIKAKQDKKK